MFAGMLWKPDTDRALATAVAKRSAVEAGAILAELSDAAEAQDACGLALSRRKQGFESPRERERNQMLTENSARGVQQLSNKRMWTGMDSSAGKSCS
jgi:hypothetical protein